MVHVGSKSVTSVRERLRLCKKKNIEIEGLSASTDAPPGGVDKKAVGKVNNSSRKVPSTPSKNAAKSNTKSKVAVKKEGEDESEENESKEGVMVEA
jgi:hypothetical protein